MSVGLSIKIKNLPQIQAKLRAMPVAMTTELRTAVQQTLAKVTRETIKESPVNKSTGGGNLRQSISSALTGTASGKLIVNSDYGIYVHEGTAPHIILPKNKKALANVRGGQFFGKKVHHTGTRANPFLHRAVENSTEEVQNYFQEAVRRVANK